MEKIEQKRLTGERALYGIQQFQIVDCLFEDGESPLKECRDLELLGCMFRWKYPLWYSKNITATDCKWFDMARAGVWYTDNIKVERALITAPKNFRRCSNVSLMDVQFTNAAETLWQCKNVTMNNVTAKGDYFAMNTADLTIDGLKLDGNYSFDGCKNVVVRNSTLLSKDAFWNCENVTVYDSFISGEYLGWNSKNITLINCTIESLQGMCYIDNLVMKNCKLINTTLAFEYATVEAQISSGIDSVFNPLSGTITCEHIGELIIEKDKVDPTLTKITCNAIHRESEHPEWIKDISLLTGQSETQS